MEVYVKLSIRLGYFLFQFEIQFKKQFNIFMRNEKWHFAENGTKAEIGIIFKSKSKFQVHL